MRLLAFPWGGSASQHDGTGLTETCGSSWRTLCPNGPCPAMQPGSLQEQRELAQEAQAGASFGLCSAPLSKKAFQVRFFF